MYYSSTHSPEEGDEVELPTSFSPISLTITHHSYYDNYLQVRTIQTYSNPVMLHGI